MVCDMSEETPWIDEKYVMMLDHYVERFRVVSRNPLLVNFRCPICGDSAKNKNKARGFVYRNRDGGSSFRCHNCGAGKSLKNLLRDVSPPLYEEYVLEKYKPRDERWSYDPKVDRAKTAETVSDRERRVPPNLVQMSLLPGDHPAVEYWNSRKIPRSGMRDAWWADAYYTWVNANVLKDKFSPGAVRHDCGRIVFPLRSRDGKITGYTGRSVAGETPKYVAVRAAADESTSAFGMDAADYSRTVYVVEGPIDSLFLDNAVAMGSSSRDVGIRDRVMVFDNEPRNSAIVSIMRRAIDDGQRVVIWPNDVEEKDINDMVLSGRSIESVREMVTQNVKRGLLAKIALNEWNKT